MLTLFTIFLNRSYIWEKPGSWDMGQNTVGQSDCTNFKATISLEQNYEIAWYFEYWCKFMESKS